MPTFGNTHTAYYCGKLLLWCHIWCPCLVMFAQWSWVRAVPLWYWSRILFLVTLVSNFVQSNLRKGNDVKCRNCPRVWFFGVKELIMFSACICCNHTDHVSDDLSEWTDFWALQLVFVSCFCDVSAMLHICFVWVIRITKSNGFLSFFICGRASSS